MSKVLDGMYGLCVADALGVPAEFRSRADLKNDPIVGMTSGGIWDQPVGYWSDDSSMALCLAKSIGMVGAFDTRDIMERFLDWYENGAYSPGGECFDVGGSCARAMNRYRYGIAPEECGGDQPRENGNGSLMRILPAVYVVYNRWGKSITREPQAMETLHTLSALTHRHPISQSACGIYGVIGCRLLGGDNLNTAVKEGIREALEWYARQPRFADHMKHWARIADPENFARQPEAEIRSSGYVVDSLEAALWCLMNTDNYRDCVLRCVNLGQDTDSVAAIAGGLAGLAYGYASIPQEWLGQLAGKNVIEDCLCSFENYLNLGVCGWEKE